MNLDSIFLLSNGIFTLLLGFSVVYLFASRRVERDIFYYLFSAGFTVYGIQILMRWMYGEYLSAQSITGAVLTGISLLLFSLGFWSLSRRKILLVTIIPSFSLGYLLLGLWFTNMIPREIAIICVPLAYFPIIFLLIIHATILRKVVDIFTFGWFLLLLVNFVLLEKGWIADVFAIFSKVLILRGVFDQDFILLTQKIRRSWVHRTVPAITQSSKEGGIQLLIPSRNSHSFGKKFKWIEEKVLENLKKDQDSFIFTFQDTFPHSALRRIKWINTEKVFVLLFSSSSQEAKKEFTVLPIEITHIGAALTELAGKYKNSDTGCTVIITNLSLLIQSFGVHSTYNMLLSKLGSLRESGIELFAFLHPETHTDKTVEPLFTNISDEVIKL